MKKPPRLYLTVGESSVIEIAAQDGDGNILPGEFNWRSTKPSVASVGEVRGKTTVRALAPGTTLLKPMMHPPRNPFRAAIRIYVTK